MMERQMAGLMRVQCHRCGRETRTEDVVRKQDVVEVMEQYSRIGFLQSTFTRHKLVNMCRWCDEQEETQRRTDKKRAIAVILVLVGVQFAGIVGLIGAGVLIAGGVLWSRHKSKALMVYKGE